MRKERERERKKESRDEIVIEFERCLGCGRKWEGGYRMMRHCKNPALHPALTDGGDGGDNLAKLQLVEDCAVRGMSRSHVAIHGQSSLAAQL